MAAKPVFKAPCEEAASCFGLEKLPGLIFRQEGRGPSGFFLAVREIQIRTLGALDKKPSIFWIFGAGSHGKLVIFW